MPLFGFHFEDRALRMPLYGCRFTDAALRLRLCTSHFVCRLAHAVSRIPSLDFRLRSPLCDLLSAGSLIYSFGLVDSALRMPVTGVCFTDSTLRIPLCSFGVADLGCVDFVLTNSVVRISLCTCS